MDGTRGRIGVQEVPTGMGLLATRRSWYVHGPDGGVARALGGGTVSSRVWSAAAVRGRARARSERTVLTGALCGFLWLPVLGTLVDANATESGCTCASLYTIDMPGCKGNSYSGCMETPCDVDDGGAARGFPSWCFVKPGCSGVRGAGNAAWDYCKPKDTAAVLSPDDDIGGRKCYFYDMPCVFHTCTTAAERKRTSAKNVRSKA